MAHESDTVPLSLPTADAQAIRVALSAMPYGGLAPRMLGLPADVTPAHVVEALNNLAAVLRDVAKRNEQTETELRELKSQRAAFRAFLGTDGAEL